MRRVIRRDCPKRLPEFEVDLHTGMRLSEQYGMLWEFVDFKNQVITIPKSKHGDARHVRMNSRVTAILSGLKNHSLGVGRVFSLHSPRCWFEAALGATGLKDFTSHCLRHTFISRLVMKGIDLRTVQELAGHKSIQMTCRYAHLAPGHEQTAVEMLVKKSAAPRRKRTVRPTATTTATGQIVANNARQLQFSKPLQVMGLDLVGPPGFEPGTNGL